MSGKPGLPTVWGDTLDELQGPIIYDEAADPIIDYCHECGHKTGSHRPHAKECRCLNCLHGRLLSYIIPADPADWTRPKFLDHLQRTEGAKISIPRWSEIKPGG